jgi:copper oxidase (laccase) domain-containing protein
VHKVIGAAHAGWRGALGGVIDSAVKAMQHAGAQHRHIKAIIGPCIRQASYEVDEDFMSPFILKNVNNSKFFQPHPLNSNKKLFDLPSYVIEMLGVAGVQQVDDAGIDTLKNAKFFSYRRARAAGMKLPGHNVSFIALKI